MPLGSNTRLGPYEIVSLAGSGGMGEVYCARDTRLDRKVAIKVLPEHFSGDPQRRERFEREAHAVAKLSHPNICPVYDVGRQDSISYLVMEFLEGETLACRLRKGPLPLPQVLQYAVEIAGALDQAHSRGVVHRDVKPGNIMLTKSGPKLLDFGLAKFRSPQRASDGMSAGSTVTVTQPGAVIGTFPYMAPEQLQGLEPDARTDIFALGAVVYEMISGHKAFEADTQADLIAAILDREPPPVAQWEKASSTALERTVRKALAKSPDDRWQTARDLKDEFEWIARENLTERQGSRIGRGDRKIGLAIASLIVVFSIVAVLILMRSRRPSTQDEVVRFSIPLPEGTVFQSTEVGGPTPQISISEDGAAVVFALRDANGTSGLWVQSFTAFAPQRLPGTEGASFPFWSPDGRRIGFFAGGKLKTIDLNSRVVRALAEAPAGRGGTWNREDTILFADNISSGLKLISAGGGARTDSTKLQTSRNETSHRFPQFLPDGRHFMYLILAPPGRLGLYLGRLDSAEATLVLPGKWSTGFVVGEYLLSVQDGGLTAHAWDNRRLALSGDRFHVVDQIASGSPSGLAAFSASRTGSLVYTTGTSPNRQLVWFDRRGKIVAPVGSLGEYSGPSLTRDGRRVAVARVDPQTRAFDIWIFDLFRGTETRFTFERGTERAPVWSADGTQLVYCADRAGTGPWELFFRGMEQRSQAPAITGGWGAFPSDWSSDGGYIVYYTPVPRTNWDIWVLPSKSPSEPKPFLQTEFNEMQGAISPDGRWLAYTSDETGTAQVYVQSFPTAGHKLLISAGGGSEPKWSRSGDELFYISLDHKLMVVRLRAGATLEPGVPQPLFEVPVPDLAAAFANTYAVSADSQRFLVNTFVPKTPSSPVSVVLNWIAQPRQ